MRRGRARVDGTDGSLRMRDRGGDSGMLRGYEAETLVKKTVKRSKVPAKRAPNSSARQVGEVKRKREVPRARRARPTKTRRVTVVEPPRVELMPESPVPVEVSAESAMMMEVPEVPEPHFASRTPPAEPDRPFPVARRAIFFDVENASRPEHITKVIDHLAVDRMGRRIDFVAVGNWRVIGHDTARLLARHGAHLVHSAPSTGVRDWSDLRIAVGAGVWLASARPGDVLEIVTNDRAFDAVGDVAASLGIAFRRLSHQGLGDAAVEPPPPVREVASDPRSHRRGRGRRRGGWRNRPRPPATASSPTASPPADHEVIVSVVEPVAAAELPAELPIVEAIVTDVPVPDETPGALPPHPAPHDEIIAVVRDLVQRSPARPVTLDSLANALKSRGFSRPPGSPRLITRLRRIKEISLSRSGVITLLGGSTAEPPPPAPPAVVEPEIQVLEAESGPEPGNEALPRTDAPHRAGPTRYRPRRGAWGRHRPPAPASAPAV